MDRSNDPGHRPDPLKECARCGTELWENVWYPVLATTDADGTTRVLSFCSEACKETWDDDGTDTSADP